MYWLGLTMIMTGVVGVAIGVKLKKRYLVILSAFFLGLVYGSAYYNLGIFG